MDVSLPPSSRCYALVLCGVLGVLATAIPARAVIPAGTTADTASVQSNSVVKAPGGSQSSDSSGTVHTDSWQGGADNNGGGTPGSLTLPEPASLLTWAIGCGLTGFALARHRRRRRLRVAR